MGTFSKIFGSGDKKLQKKAEECLLQLSKYLQSASAKMRITAKLWVRGEHDKLDELEEEVIKLERKADRTKEHLVEKVLSEHAFLPQQTQERHSLALHMDAIIDAAEDAVRIMVVGKGMNPAPEILDIAEKCWICTDLLQDSVKYLFKDFKRSAEITRKVDLVREEARDIQYKLLKRLFRDPDSGYKPTEIHFYKTVSERVLDVAIKSELAGDFIRELAIKYS
jgi:predicted phosphate transport protein (TIGR00153 family)